MKILMALLATLTLCSTFSGAQAVVGLSPEDQIRAAAQQALSRAMAPYDAALAVRVREAYQQIATEAAGVRLELQAGYIRDQEAEVRALAARRRAAYEQQVWASISKVMEKAIEEKRWELLGQRLDQLQTEFERQTDLTQLYRRKAAENP